MRHFVDVDDEQFVVFEEKTEPRYCPTCGSSRSVTLDRRIMLVQGDRSADETTWSIIKQEHREQFPLFDNVKRAAYEFAGVGEGRADTR